MSKIDGCQHKQDFGPIALMLFKTLGDSGLYPSKDLRILFMFVQEEL